MATLIILKLLVTFLVTALTIPDNVTNDLIFNFKGGTFSE